MIRNAIIGVLVVALAGSAAFRLYAETKVRGENETIHKLEREKAQLQAEIDRLTFEVEVLQSAPRLGELSADRLPLQPAGARQVVDGEGLRDVLEAPASQETRP